MKEYFPQFVFGKVFENRSDKTGFSIIGKTSEIEEKDCYKYVPLANIGQILTWDNFRPVFVITNSLEGRRGFCYTTKSSISDNRGYVPIQKYALVPESIEKNFLEIAKSLIDGSSSDNHEKSSNVGSIDGLFYEAVPLMPSDIWNEVRAYTKSILQILDGMFSANAIVVVSKEQDIKLKILIANVLYLLLPQPLKQNFSLHTGFYGSTDQILSKIMFTEPRLFDEKRLAEKRHIKIELKLDDESSSSLYKTPYAAYLERLLFSNAIGFDEIIKHCDEFLMSDLQFSTGHSKLIYEDLKARTDNLLLISDIVNGRQGLALSQVLDFLMGSDTASYKTDIQNLIWAYLKSYENKKNITEYFFSNKRNTKVLLSTGEDISLAWVGFLLELEEVELIRHLFNFKLFFEITPEKVIDAFLFFFKNELEVTDQNGISLLIEYLIYLFEKNNNFLGVHLDSKDIKKIKNFKSTFLFLSQLTSQTKNMDKKLYEPINIVAELSSKNQIELALLEVMVAKSLSFYKYIDNSVLLDISKEQYARFIKAVVEKTGDSFKELSLKDLGSLLAISYKLNLKIEPKFLPANKIQDHKALSSYIHGILDTSIFLPNPTHVVQYIASEIEHTTKLELIEIYITFLKLNTKKEIDSYLINQISQLYSLNSKDGQYWKELGESLFLLCLEKQPEVLNVFSDRLLTGYLRSFGKLTPLNICDIVLGIISFKFTPNFYLPVIINELKQHSKYTTIERIDSLYSLFFCEFDHEVKENVQKYILPELMVLECLDLLSDEKVYEISVALVIKSVYSLQLEEEIYRRLLRKSIDEFSGRLIEDVQKDKHTNDYLSGIVTRVWKEANYKDFQKLSEALLENKCAGLAEALKEKIISGTITIEPAGRLEVIRGELENLEKKINDLENTLSLAVKNFPQITHDENNVLLYLIDSLMQRYSKETNVYLLLLKLRENIAPTKNKGLLGLLRKK